MIELKKASSADARILAQMRHRVWLQTYRGIYPDEMLDSYDLDFYTNRDRTRMEAPGNHYYFFRDGEAVVGYFSFGTYHYGTYKDFALCLNNLYILQEYQGRGLGRRAFEVLKEYCRQENVDKFFCGCNAHNLPAVSFYRHMGGIAGDTPNPDVPKHDQIMHFEFYLGE